MLRTLKTLTLFSFMLIFTLTGSGAWAADDNLQTIDVSAQVNTRSFLISDNNESGALIYVVDRTTGLCFASLRIARAIGSGLGLTQVECKRLTKIPSIAAFMKTGRVR
jgi:hypothetical protein